jgi:hypothetical protein
MYTLLKIYVAIQFFHLGLHISESILKGDVAWSIIWSVITIIGIKIWNCTREDRIRIFCNND